MPISPRGHIFEQQKWESCHMFLNPSKEVKNCATPNFSNDHCCISSRMYEKIIPIHALDLRDWLHLGNVETFLAPMFRWRSSLVFFPWKFTWNTWRFGSNDFRISNGWFAGSKSSINIPGCKSESSKLNPTPSSEAFWNGRGQILHHSHHHISSYRIPCTNINQHSTYEPQLQKWASRQFQLLTPSKLHQAPPRDMFSTAPVGPAVACFAKARMSSHFFFLVRLYRVHQEKRKIELRSDFTNKHDMVTICAMNVYM